MMTTSQITPGLKFRSVLCLFTSEGGLYTPDFISLLQVLRAGRDVYFSSTREFDAAASKVEHMGDSAMLRR